MNDMSVIDLTEEGFSSIAEETRPVLLDFYADWCAPCRAAAPALEALAAERQDILVGRVNIDSQPALAERFGVMSIPTFILLCQGKETARAVGVRSREELAELL